MLIFFKDGRSAWFPAAKESEIENGWLVVLGPRNRRIAEVCAAHVAFWCWDNENVTSYGYPETADPDRKHA